MLVLNFEEIGRVNLATSPVKPAAILQINLNGRLRSFISFQFDASEITELFTMITYSYEVSSAIVFIGDLILVIRRLALGLLPFLGSFRLILLFALIPT